MDRHFDILIIGSGVVGSAAARELSKYKLRIGVLEKNPDVVNETSGRNSGVLHAGFNNRPGSKMARFCVEGNAGFDKVAQELDIPLKRTGKLVVGFTPRDRERLEAMKAQGEQNGTPGLSIVDREFIRAKAPEVRGEFALWSGSTAILSPFIYTIGLAENACKNGVQFFFRHEVTSIRDDGTLYTVQAGGEEFTSRWIVNCAGLGSAKISTMLGIDEYTIYPCRGEYIVLDRRAGNLLPVPAYPVPDPTSGGLGIHLTPTIDGNIIVGPSNEYLDESDDYASTAEVRDMLIKDGSRIFPHLKPEYYIRSFCGIRPKLSPKTQGGYRDFVIERRDDIAPRAVNLVGIESPGLTSSLPIAREVVRLIQEVETLTPNPDFDPIRRRIVTFRDKTPEEQAELIRENPDYGEIICRCGTITRAEVVAALHSPIPAKTLTGIKYRCRAMMGRCQGGYCQTRLVDILMEETGMKREEILYKYEGSYLFTGKVQEE